MQDFAGRQVDFFRHSKCAEPSLYTRVDTREGWINDLVAVGRFAAYDISV